MPLVQSILPGGQRLLLIESEGFHEYPHIPGLGEVDRRYFWTLKFPQPYYDIGESAGGEDQSRRTSMDYRVESSG